MTRFQYLARAITLLGFGRLAMTQNGTTNPWPWQTYRSEPTLQPPSLKVTQTGDIADGHLFFDQSGSGAHNYSMFIMSNDNELIWEGAYGDISAYRPQILDGEPVLTYFTGITFPEPYGFGYGAVFIFDQTYKNIINVTLPQDKDGLNMQTITGWDSSGLTNGSWIDMHENLITAEGTMFIPAINVTQTDLTSVGGPANGWIADSMFFEVDVKTSDILFQWSHLDHLDEIPLIDSAAVYPLDGLGLNQSYPWGPFHINSIERFADGGFLVSSRYYCSIFKIARNGSVEWTLNGRTGGSFALKNGLSFCYQHDARIHGEGNGTALISLFNNDNSGVASGVNETSGILLTVNTATWEASLKQEFIDPNDTIFAVSQGNMQVLNDGTGHVIVGYGSTPKIKEFNADGECVFTAQFGEDKLVQSYRNYRFPWVGKPYYPPKAFACGNGNQTEVYMSWNGATEHKKWAVFAGDDKNALSEKVAVEKSGFETKATFSGLAQFVKVEATGEDIPTGTSEVIEVVGKC
ncbi:uncharacterized protein CTRU02_207940 [Colletotrichum truncatum]|uniref:Uncharacterized protein n=1 Tax=Colletotrichum truncatum TaxID=5467 RepID=A0ACC3Z297_COLTU|nr:uncharacterized protein CTRU02_11036 [Colletotrichum truncatum]KAF6786538.1 hypothetical protein CTRU02_11036 [Colletotrichum truncatum]